MLFFGRIEFYRRDSTTMRLGRTLTGLLFLLLVCSSAATLEAQSSAKQTADTSANDERVQELYAEAKTAESRGDLNSAAASYESLLKIAPRLAPAYNNLGALYLRAGQYEKAAETLERGLKIDPKMYSAVALLGIARYEIGDYSGARTALETALRGKPTDDNAELFLANDLIKSGDLDGAADHLKKLSQRKPDNQEVLYLLGKVHMKLSEQALSRLNQINPDSAWVHEISGEVMESMKNYDGAVIEYKKAVEIAPQQAGTHYSLGNAYMSLSMWDAAAEQFRLELAIDPTNCMARWKLGSIAVEQRSNIDQAVAEIQKALSACPNLTGARLDRARALLKLERPGDALPDLEAAVKSDPSEPSTHFLLAQAYRGLGKPDQAQAEMKIFGKLEESARAASAERARQQLQEKETRQ
jgi:tetratricopeptide (TPR) repeat protein